MSQPNPHGTFINHVPWGPKHNIEVNVLPGRGRGRLRFTFNGNITPFPIIIRPEVQGLRATGLRLAEIWRESA